MRHFYLLLFQALKKTFLYHLCQDAPTHSWHYFDILNLVYFYYNFIIFCSSKTAINTNVSIISQIWQNKTDHPSLERFLNKQEFINSNRSSVCYLLPWVVTCCGAEEKSPISKWGFQGMREAWAMCLLLGIRASTPSCCWLHLTQQSPSSQFPRINLRWQQLINNNKAIKTLLIKGNLKKWKQSLTVRIGGNNVW